MRDEEQRVPDPLVEAAMRAGRAERPSDEARHRALAALGVAGALGAGASAAQAAQGAAQAAAKGASASLVGAGGKAAVGQVGTAVTKGFVAKWMIGGAASALLISTAAVQLTEAPSRAPSAASAAPAASAQARLARPAAPAVKASPVEAPTEAAVEPPAGAASAPARLAAPSVAAPLAAAPSAATAPSVAASSAAAPGAEGPAASEMSDEIELQNAARQAIRAGDAAAALARLDEYSARFPRGALSQEAYILRIEALALVSPPQARAMAQAFLDKNPRSPAAARLRPIAGAPGAGAPAQAPGAIVKEAPF